MIYLDNNATTQPLPEVTQKVAEAHERYWANPSSVHRFGQQVRQQMELARQQLATLIHTVPRQLVLTSGGTESNNLAINGFLKPFALDPKSTRKPVLFAAKSEHAAVREPAEQLVAEHITTESIRVGSNGILDFDGMLEDLQIYANAEHVVLISVAWANNETGVIQPMDELLTKLRDFRGQHPDARIFVHTDATQAVGKLSVDVQTTPIDLLTFAPHKFHGPKGIGALYLKRNVRLMKQNRGGPQETGRRGGTENLPAILGAGVAAEAGQTFLQDTETIAQQTALRDQLEQRVLDAIPGASVNAAEAPRLWNTTNLAFPGLEAEAILLGLSEKNVCASAGAACSSGSLDPSPVLLAMGLPEPVAHGSVRFSLSRFSTQDEIDQAVDVLTNVVQRLGRVMPV